MLKGFIRISAFFTKELEEIIRQPRLVMSLILGPFLVLLLFGIGYRAQARPLRTLLVLPPNSAIEAQAKEYATSLGEQLVLAGTTGDKQAALDQLTSGQVDVVVVVPSDAYQTIASGQQATIELYHHEIDPNQVNYVKYFGQLYVQEVNRRILATMAERGQTQASGAQQDLRQALDATEKMQAALRAGDRAEAQVQAGRLRTQLGRTRSDLTTSEMVLGAVAQTVGGGQGSKNPGEILQSLDQLDKEAATAQDSVGSSSTDSQATADNLSRLDADLKKTDDLLSKFQSVPPEVLVSPFKTETKDVAQYQPSFVAFYSPGVLALVLQHMAVSLAALSLVRERLLGTLEVFRVSPLSTAEALLGKYLSFMFFGLVIGGVLTGVTILVLGVPVLGPVVVLGEAIALLVLASLGIGFVISAISNSDTQAVQLSMLVLLASMFFSGFIMPLNTLWAPVQIVSYLLPVTHAILILQDVMLRGTWFFNIYWLALTVEGILLAVAAWWLFRRVMRQP